MTPSLTVHAPSHIRNLAIIAHIDHGKTTLIDAIFRAARVFRDNAHVEERVMDSNDLERERGITIRSKHCTVEWQGYLINIIDTPGHADFSGEVERVLSMVDSVLLLVDANEGPMPQTRYVLMRALRLGLRPIVIVNKADRPNADPSGALDATFDLFVELAASNEQLDFPVLYGSGLEGWIVNDLDEYRREERDREAHLSRGGELSPALRAELAAAGMRDLFETIVAAVPPPRADLEAPFLMQVSTLAWSDYIGRIGCGRVLQGRLAAGDELRRVSTRRSSSPRPAPVPRPPAPVPRPPAPPRRPPAPPRRPPAPAGRSPARRPRARLTCGSPAASRTARSTRSPPATSSGSPAPTRSASATPWPRPSSTPRRAPCRRSRSKSPRSACSSWSTTARWPATTAGP